jgi:hypothetical protein
MSFQPVHFYQTGTFTVGNRLLAEEERSVQAEHGTYQFAQLGAPRLSGLW